VLVFACLPSGLGCRERSSETTFETEIDVSQAISLLDESLERGSPAPAVLARLSNAAVRVDPLFGVAWTRRAASLLATAERRCDTTEALLAMHVAPHDRALRNDLLGSAVTSGRVCLGDEENWVAREPSPGTVFLGPSLARARDLLDLRISLWEILAGGNVNDVSSVRKLMQRAEASGGLDGDVPQGMIDILRRELAGHDPELLIASWPEREPGLAWFCFEAARGRHLQGSHDVFTKRLLLQAARMGFREPELLPMLFRYDPEAAIAVARKTGSLASIIGPLASRDPDRALALAGDDSDLVDQVSRVWARLRPEQIEEPLAHQEDASRRKRARAESALELFRRGGVVEELKSPQISRACFAVAESDLPKEERLDFLWRCIRSEHYDRRLRVLYAARIFAIDLVKGKEALDYVMERSRPVSCAALGPEIARVSPEALLALYRACPGEESQFGADVFTSIAIADPDFACREAARRTQGDRDTALANAALGIAERDWERASDLMESLPESIRTRYSYALQVRLLQSAPSRAADVKGEIRQSVLNGAAVSFLQRDGNAEAVHRIIEGSTKEEADRVLAYCAEATARSDESLAASLAREIQDPRIFSTTVAAVAEVIASKRWDGSSDRP
jgi:hypothetical protein